MIHDRYFELDNIQFDKNIGELIIRFEQEYKNELKILKNYIIIKKKSIPVYENILKISNVNKYSIQDTEKINRYTFNEIHYVESTQELKITSGIPMEINILVDNLAIEIIEKEKLIKNIVKYEL